jgi:murein DD-endopeptidase MepM/ murein hydrolase activator NlpD
MTALEALLLKEKNVFVIESSIPYSEYTPIDLSAQSELLKNQKLSTSKDYELFLENYLNSKKAFVAYGGYNEKRNLYKRSEIFNNTAIAERNNHIGLDLWVDAGTPVLAALNGKVHSYSNNEGIGNYGPTIIIEHHIKNSTFYTLYGHLSPYSIMGLEVGLEVEKGDIIATLGTALVNGDYAPHLHFQIIQDLGNHTGDYPGVCSDEDLAYYLSNCPDPNLLLKINA